MSIHLEEWSEIKIALCSFFLDCGCASNSRSMVICRSQRRQLSTAPTAATATQPSCHVVTIATSVSDEPSPPRQAWRRHLPSQRRARASSAPFSKPESKPLTPRSPPPTAPKPAATLRRSSPGRHAGITTPRAPTPIRTPMTNVTAPARGHGTSSPRSTPSSSPAPSRPGSRPS